MKTTSEKTVQLAMKHLAEWMMGLIVAILLSAAACPATGGEPEGKGPVYGGQFSDRFLPMPVQGKLTSGTWGADHVKPRDVDNVAEIDQSG